MLTRAQILKIIDDAYKARKAGDKNALAKFWAPGATIHVVGEQRLLDKFPFGRRDADSTVHKLIELIDFDSVKIGDAIVEGNRAAVLIDVTMSSGKSGSHKSQFFDFWELDDQGRGVSLIQFIDTALVAEIIVSR